MTDAKLSEGTMDGWKGSVNTAFEPQLILKFIRIEQSVIIQKSSNKSKISLTERMRTAHSA